MEILSWIGNYIMKMLTFFNLNPSVVASRLDLFVFVLGEHR